MKNQASRLTASELQKDFHSGGRYIVGRQVGNYQRNAHIYAEGESRSLCGKSDRTVNTRFHVYSLDLPACQKCIELYRKRIEKGA